MLCSWSFSHKAGLRAVPLARKRVRAWGRRSLEQRGWRAPVRATSEFSPVLAPSQLPARTRISRARSDIHEKRETARSLPQGQIWLLNVFTSAEREVKECIKVTIFWQDWACKVCRFSVLFGYLAKWEPNWFEISRDHFDFFDLFFNFFEEERIIIWAWPK